MTLLVLLYCDDQRKTQESFFDRPRLFGHGWIIILVKRPYATLRRYSSLELQILGVF